MAVLGEHIWQRFCEVIGRLDLVGLPQFADGVLRQKNLAELNLSIDPWMTSKAEAVAELPAGHERRVRFSAMSRSFIKNKKITRQKKLTILTLDFFMFDMSRVCIPNLIDILNQTVKRTK